MGIDLFIAGLVLLFAIFGALSGAARQVAQLAGLVAAYLCARPIGTFFGPRLAGALDVPLVLGTIGATILTFIIVLVAVRFVLTTVLRRILAGREPDSRGLDRGLGFALGAAKTLLVIYIVLSGVTFLEKHMTLKGRRLVVTSRESLAFGVARKWNLFEMTQFSAVKDLAQVSQAAGTRGSLEEIEQDPAFQSLKQDPRFRRVLEDPVLRRAAENGDYAALLQSDAVLQLVQDPTMAARLGAAADAATAK